MVQIELLHCVACNSTNVFLEKDNVSTCRLCGCKSPFFWSEAPPRNDLKLAILALFNGSTEEAKKGMLKLYSFHYELNKEDEKDSNKIYRQLYDLFIYKTFGRIVPRETLQEDAKEHNISDRKEKGKNTPKKLPNGVKKSGL